MKTSNFLMRNWASELGVPFSDVAFSPSAPLANIVNPRPGEFAQRETVASGPFHVGVDFNDPVFDITLPAPVDIAAIVNTNLIGNNSGPVLVDCRIEDDDGDWAVFLPVQNEWYGERELQEYIVCDLDTTPIATGGTLDRTRVIEVRFRFFPLGAASFGRRDTFRGLNAEAFPRFGSIIAGPSWKPKNGVALDGATQSLIDAGDTQEAVSGAKFARVRSKKLRHFDGTFAMVPEEEYFSVPRGLRELSLYAGTSRPVLMYPGQAFEWVYGFFDDNIKWTAVGKNEQQGVLATAAMSLRESI